MSSRTPALVLGLLVSATVAGASLAQPRGTPPAAGFVHAGAPHMAGFEPTNASRGRPVLVVYGTFSDRAALATEGEATVRARAFGPAFPNLVDYFRSVSGGRLALSPAAESSGTPNDGVVVASVGTYASYATPPDASDELGRQRARARAMVQAADAAVDFRAFDRNGDGRVTTDELAVIGLHAEDVANAAYTRDMDRELVLDGKRVQLRVALAPIGVGLGTIIHEAAHVVLNQRDMYGWGVGWHALGGGMVDRSTQLYHPSGWEKIHLGWARPVVVSHDGYYDVPRLDGPDPAAYILYDPAKGTQHYFVVENRVRSPGTYEQDVADTGLFVSRVDERRFLDNELRAVEPMWPRGQLNAKREWGAPPGESYAWDPLDPTTPQRELSAPWGDQTPSNVAIRAVGARGDVVRAYFDVPGPGALVDCFDSAGPSGDKRVGLLAGRATTARLPIMNTGDAPDELEVRVEGAPAGVTIAPVRRRLGAKERALVDLVVTAPSTLPSTTTRAWAVVESTANRAVGSRCPVSLVGPSAYGYAWYAHGGPQTAAYDLSSSGGAVTKTRRDVGHYEVSFAGLTGAGGVAHVRAYGSTEAHCSLDSWWSAGDALKVAVRCWDSADRPRDASFLLGYARPTQTAFSLTQLWSHVPSVDRFVPERTYQYSSTGAVTEVRRTAVGHYEVRVPGAVDVEAFSSSLVTAYGTPARCAVTGGTLEAAARVFFVRCDGAAGPRDSAFTLTHSTGTNYFGVDTPSAIGWVTYPFDGPLRQFRSTGGAGARVQRRAVGSFVVTFPGLSGAGGTATISSVGERCAIERFGPGSGGLEIAVLCAVGGRPSNESFGVAYVR